jgi:soluble P-type ATPase
MCGPNPFLEMTSSQEGANRRAGTVAIYDQMAKNSGERLACETQGLVNATSDNDPLGTNVGQSDLKKDPERHSRQGGLAVVMDVAGTMLRMYRVAKDLPGDRLLENVVTFELILEKRFRALVVPQLDPAVFSAMPPETSLFSLIRGREEMVDVSCSSAPVSKEEALRVIRSSGVSISGIQETHRAVQSRCPGAYETSGIIVDAELSEVSYALSTGGRPFPGLKGVLSELRILGAEVYVASGDSKRSLTNLSGFLNLDQNRVYPTSTPSRKREIVMDLKKRYGQVVMVGDGLNDLKALEVADLGVLTVEQDSRPPDRLFKASDVVIREISSLPEIIKEAFSP